MRFLHIAVCCLSFFLAFRSPNAGSGTRAVGVQFPYGDEPAIAKYETGVEPPVVVIRSPAEDDTVGPEEYVPAGDPKATPSVGIVITASVSWPDGHPRNIRRATLLVNGEPQAVLDAPPDSLTFVWNPDGGLPSGPVTLQVQIEDEFGLEGRSGQIVVRMETGSSLCPAGSRSALCNIEPDGLLPFLAIGLALIALGLVLVHRQEGAGAETEFVPEAGETLRIKDHAASAKAALTDLDGNAGVGQSLIKLYGTTSIGRSHKNAGLVLQANKIDSPISRLHCTILEEDGAFFLRDEQSANGTYLNGVRLAPMDRNPLKDGDLIQLADPEHNGVRLQFRLQGGKAT